MEDFTPEWPQEICAFKKVVSISPWLQVRDCVSLTDTEGALRRGVQHTAGEVLRTLRPPLLLN